MKFFEEKEDVFVSVQRGQILEINNVQNVTLFFLSKPDFDFKDNSLFFNIKKNQEYVHIEGLNDLKVFIYLTGEDKYVNSQIIIKKSKLAVFDDEKVNFSFLLSDAEIDFSIYGERVEIKCENEVIITGVLNTEFLKIDNKNESNIHLSGIIKNTDIQNKESTINLAKANISNANILNDNGKIWINPESFLSLIMKNACWVSLNRKPEVIRVEKDESSTLLVDDFTYTKYSQEEANFNFMSYTMEDFNKLLQKNKLQSDVAKKEDLFYNNFNKEDKNKNITKDNENETEEKIKNRL